jgi:hypothetical protein
MKKIYDFVIRNKVIKEINRIGGEVTEIVLDIDLSEMIINSIEYKKSENILILHVFIDNMDYCYDFDSMSEDDKLLILTSLSFY